MTMTTRVVLLCAFAIVLAARLCHTRILWAEEGYPAAAAAQILHGKVLYRDIWFDKPPIYAAAYLLWDGEKGVPLRWAGAMFVILSASLLYRFALDLWGQMEALFAGSLLAFFLTFGIPSAVMALAPDLLMLLPHVAAVYLASRGHPFWSGFLAGIALLTNSKGVLVLAAVLLWQMNEPLAVAAGFLLPNLCFMGFLWANGALGAYYEQVWKWGFLYSADTFVTSPIRTGLVRTASWAGFHAAIVIAAIYAYRKESRRLLWWTLISLIGVIAGWRFFPRYYFQLLPPLTLAAARGLTMMSPRWRTAVLMLLLVPALRFGPRYVTLAEDLVNHRPHQWTDIAMNQDSRAAGEIVRSLAGPHDNLLVWGYRADVYLYSGLPAGTRFLDSQPLTGVLADRHLTESRPTAPGIAARNRQELLRTKPSFIVDGLAPYNPALGIDRFADLRDWLNDYQVVAHTQGTVIYRLLAGPGRSALLQKR